MSILIPIAFDYPDRFDLQSSYYKSNGKRRNLSGGCYLKEAMRNPM